MKQSPELQKIQDRMQPGAITMDGFLGYDTRKLVDILNDDLMIVKAFDLSHDQIASRMKYLTDRGKETLETPVIVEQFYMVVVEEHRGKIPCPFGDNYHIPKVNTTVTNMITGKIVKWSDLNIHMIGYHGFYEGVGALFRVEPSKIIEVIGLR